MESKAIATITTIPSLPRRLVDLASAVGTVQHPGQPLRHNLPAGMSMSEAERREAEGALRSLTSLLDPTAPFADPDGQPESAGEAKSRLLTKLVQGLAGEAKPTKAVLDSKIDWYADAIEDLPAWAIDRAMKMWARSECPRTIEAEPRYAFPPAPGTLRLMALWQMDTPKRHAELLKNLLAAIPVARAMDPAPMPGSSPGIPALRRM